MSTAEEKATEEQAFADKLAKRPPPDPVERAEIEKARKRTKARAPRIAMHVDDRETAGSVVYPAHSDEEGHMYRLADAFGTRSRQFVYSMLKGLGNATADHSLNLDFSPASPDQIAFNAALAVIDGVRPKDAGRQRQKSAAVDYTAAQAVAAALLASGMGNTATASGPRPRLRSSGNSAHC
jgi:hypothetical protein